MPSPTAKKMTAPMHTTSSMYSIISFTLFLGFVLFPGFALFLGFVLFPGFALFLGLRLTSCAPGFLFAIIIIPLERRDVEDAVPYR